MCMTVLPIGEARRRLPELVRKVAGGHAPILIGRRGRCEAILAAAAGARDAVVRRPLEGLVEIVGAWKDVERAQEEIRNEIAASLDRTARLIAGKPPKRPTRRRRRG
ncbi:MAG: type II toxin-antitoxin system Phd/YefM family antitoxin [Deltaproteobacteria bacterium]|nr:MAG: type II toxin-antitoxin system Phd/YefM family antitoxin [Deltaproteobacteria bacterium]